MKKNLKKNFKRWIAFLLAVVLITTTCVYSSDSFLRAEGEGVDVESQTEPASEEVEVTPTEVEDSESESDSDTDESDSDADDFEEEETDEDEEEVSEGEDAETSDEALDEENVEESDVESEETTEEKAPASGEETGETYSYAIYYFYDGVEDEDARVEKEDGVLGEKILDADSVEKEVTIGEKSYGLVEIKNKDGEIREDGDNIVEIYYESIKDEKPVEEEIEKEYSLEFIEPSEGGTVEIVSVDGEKGNEENSYKEGTKVAFKVSVDEGYKISTVEDQDYNELKPESSNEDDREYTYVVTMMDNMVITVSCEMAIRQGIRKARARDGEPTTYTIIFEWSGDDDVPAKRLGRETITANVGDEISGYSLIQSHPMVTDGEGIWMFYPKGLSFNFEYGSEWKAGEAIPELDGRDQILVLGSDPNKNIIYINYSSKSRIQEQAQVQINFVANGGTDVGAMLGQAGVSIPNRNMPETTREGYIFDGWYDNEELSGNRISELPTVYPDSDITYYAKWVKKEQPKAELTYDANGGSGNAPNKVTETVGTEVTVAGGNDLKKEGYTFEGWNTQADGNGTDYAAGDKITLNGNITLYAQWEVDDSEYRVEYWLQNADNDEYTLDIQLTLTDKTGESVSAPEETYTGFVKVTKLDSKESGVVLADGSLVLKVYYDRKTYNITYKITGELFAQDLYKEQKDVRYGAAISLITDDMKKAGYDWSGWGGFPADGKMPAAPVVVEGSYSASANTGYTVRHWYQNIENDEYTENEPEKQELTGTTGQPTNAAAKSVEGFTAQEFSQATIAADGSTVVNIYYKRNLYSVTYKIEGSYFATESYKVDGPKKYGAAISLITDSMKKDGYDWSGWSGFPEGGKMPADGAVVVGSYSTRTDTEYTVEYYWQNTEDDEYTLHETRGADGSLKGETGSEVSAAILEYTGFEHATTEESKESGVIAADGSLVLKVYYDRKTYSITYKITGELFAQDPYGEQETVRYGAAISLIEDDMKKDGYDWSGWKDFPADGKMPAAPVVVQGNYQARSDTKYTIVYHYQDPSDGSYGEIPVTKTATTDTRVTLSSDSLKPNGMLSEGGYIYDENDSRNEISGVVTGDGELVLHVYFPIQYSVTGTIENGSVNISTQNVRYNESSAEIIFTASSNYIIKSIQIKVAGQFTEQAVEYNQTTYTYPVQNNIKNDIEVIVQTEEMRPSIKLDKRTTSSPANGIAYALDETISYEIVALNNGNMVLTDVIVVDELTGGKWEIAEIKPGQSSLVMTTSYTVTQDDIRKGGTIHNVATIEKDTDPDKPDPEVDPGIKDDPIVQPNASLFVEKKADGNESSKTYAPGEEIQYSIRVLNNGNMTIGDITVTDDLTGESWFIESLDPEKEQTFTTTYTVTEDDIRNGTIVNVATITGTDPDGNPVEITDTETVKTDPLEETLDVVKTVINPQGQYNVGDTVRYQIAVTNTGNVTLHNVRVTDTLIGTNGNVIFTNLANGKLLENGDIEFSELGAGVTETLNCEYSVKRSDANSAIGNMVEVTSDEVDIPVSDATEDTPVERLYTLTIRYVYENGVAVRNDVVQQYLAGESFGPFYSPEVEGYNASMAYVRSGRDGMPARDVVITIIYSADGTGTDSTLDSEPDPVPPIPDPIPATPDLEDTPNPTVVALVPAPGGGAPVVLVAPQLAAIEDAAVPLGGAIVQDDDGNVVIIPVEDEEVPLTNREIDNHKCCILSFLLMLATLVIYSCFTHSMKKRQKKLAELKDQLAEETLKRQLGITDETSSRR